jgi:hypothetical protein
MPKYLVGYDEDPFGDQDFVIVNAADEDEAIERFIKTVAITEDIFLEHIYEKAVNMSLAEMFWFQTEDEMDRFMQEGEVVISVEEFERRVKEFFGPHADFAARYLEYYFSEDDEIPSELFPEEMLMYIWSESDWADDVIAVPLDDVEEV